MDINTATNQAEAYRNGQRDGMVAGVIAATAAYWLFKAYKPTAAWSQYKARKNDPES